MFCLFHVTGGSWRKRILGNKRNYLFGTICLGETLQSVCRSFQFATLKEEFGGFHVGRIVKSFKSDEEVMKILGSVIDLGNRYTTSKIKGENQDRIWDQGNVTDKR